MSLYQHLKREKEVTDYVSATSLFLYTERAPRRATQRREERGQTRRDTLPFAFHRVVPHDQLASEGFAVEVAGRSFRNDYSTLGAGRVFYM